jgi:DNA-binding CsgD family transcriptional regulator
MNKNEVITNENIRNLGEWAALQVVKSNVARETGCPFLRKAYADGGAGKLLGISSCTGLAICFALSLAIPFNNKNMASAHAVCIAAAIFVMMYIAIRKLDISGLMKFANKRATGSAARNRYKYVLCAVCGAIAIMSYMIGVNDVIIYPIQFGGITTAYFISQLLYLPGLFIAGMLAEIRRGKYLPIATLGCVLFSAPVITLLNDPEKYMSYSWITYFVGGFYLMYIMISLAAIVHRSCRPAPDITLAGFLFFLFSGIGAFSSGTFTKADVFVSLSVYAVLAICLMVAFYLSGGLRAVSLVDPEPDIPAPGRTFKELVAAGGITDREAEVLCLLLKGKGTSAIADELFITEKTVQKYISSMLSKTNTKSRSALITMFAGK